MSMMQWGFVVNKTTGSGNLCGDHWQYKTSCRYLPGSKSSYHEYYKESSPGCCSIAPVLLLQRRAHQETEDPYNDYRLLLQGTFVIAYPETKVQEVMYEEF